MPVHDDSGIRGVYLVSWECQLRSEENSSKLFVSITKDKPNDSREED